MKNFLVSLFLLAGLALSPLATAAEAMDDAAMSDVVGGDGIAIGIDYGVNTDSSGAPIASDPAINGCVGATVCRFAYNIFNRSDAVKGLVWTVFKNSWMNLRIPTLNIGVEPTMSTIGSNTAYFDAAKFTGYDGSGNTICLLPSGNCTDAASSGIGSLPAVKLFYPAASYSSASYNSVTQVSSGYSSMQIGLNIGRMALEFGATGYLSDTNTKSFLGARIADNSNPYFASVAIGGTGYVYGF